MKTYLYNTSTAASFIIASSGKEKSTNTRNKQTALLPCHRIPLRKSTNYEHTQCTRISKMRCLGQVGVTGTKFTSVPEITETLDEKDETMVFRNCTQDCDYSGRRNKEGRPPECSHLQTGAFLQQGQRGNADRACKSP